MAHDHADTRKSARSPTGINLFGAIGRRISVLRKAAGLSQRQLIAELQERHLDLAGTRLKQSYIWQLENGLILPKRKLDLIEKIAELLAEKVGWHRARPLINLTKLAKIEFDLLSVNPEESKSETNNKDKSRGIRDDRQLLIREIEQYAEVFRYYQFAVIPGLLQTREYATKLMSRYAAHSDTKLPKMVAGRIARQTILDDKQRIFKFLFREEGLYAVPLSQPEMDRQVEKIAMFANRENIDFFFVDRSCITNEGILPHPQAFIVLDDYLLMLESFMRQQFEMNEDVIETYSKSFDGHCSIAHAGNEALEHLRRSANEAVNTWHAI